MPDLKLYMILLGCRPPGRHTEQHDVFLGIAATLDELIPEVKKFWSAGQVHIDAWREVTSVEGHRISIVLRNTEAASAAGKLFFINLGGYLPNRFEEQHYIVLTVKPDKGAAFKEAKASLFYKNNHFAGAVSHIDDKFGVDVDDLYHVEEMLTPAQKQKYQLEISPAENLSEDEMHLGYLNLN